MTAHHKIVLLFKDGSSEEFLVGLCSPVIPNFDTAGRGPLSQPFYVDSMVKPLNRLTAGDFLGKWSIFKQFLVFPRGVITNNPL